FGSAGRNDCSSLRRLARGCPFAHLLSVRTLPLPADDHGVAAARLVAIFTGRPAMGRDEAGGNFRRAIGLSCDACRLRRTFVTRSRMPSSCGNSYFYASALFHETAKESR